MAKILAIDDDPSIIALYDELLKDGGYVVSTADDPVTAVAKFRTFEPDLIICDWDMPSGGGKTFFQSLRAVMSKGVPVIFITGRDADDLGSALKFSKVAYIKKPFSRDILFGKIEEFLGSAKPAQAEPDLMTLPTVDFQGMRVLVIDHILEEVDFLQRLLVNEGCETVASPDAPAGATTLGLYKPRVVFCNWDLPLKSARKFITTLRDTMHDTTPVIFMSEKDKAAIPEAFQAANTLYLKRPFTKLEALAAITKILSAKIVAEAAPSPDQKSQEKEPDAWATSPIAIEIPPKAAPPAQQAPQAAATAQAVQSPASIAPQAAAPVTAAVKTAVTAAIPAQASAPSAAPKPAAQAPLPAQAKAPVAPPKIQPLPARIQTTVQGPAVARPPLQSPAPAKPNGPAAQKAPALAQKIPAVPGQAPLPQRPAAPPPQFRPQPPAPGLPAQPRTAQPVPVRQAPPQATAQKIAAPPLKQTATPRPAQQPMPIQRPMTMPQQPAPMPQMRPPQPNMRPAQQPPLPRPPQPRLLQPARQAAAPGQPGQMPGQPVMARPALPPQAPNAAPQPANIRPAGQPLPHVNPQVTGHRPPLATTPRTGTPRRRALPPLQQPLPRQQPTAQIPPQENPAPRQSAVGKFFGGLFGGKKN